MTVPGCSSMKYASPVRIDAEQGDAGVTVMMSVCGVVNESSPDTTSV
jgi:hypothetical protein